MRTIVAHRRAPLEGLSPPQPAAVAGRVRPPAFLRSPPWTMDWRHGSDPGATPVAPQPPWPRPAVLPSSC